MTIRKEAHDDLIRANYGREPTDDDRMRMMQALARAGVLGAGVGPAVGAGAGFLAGGGETFMPLLKAMGVFGANQAVNEMPPGTSFMPQSLPVPVPGLAGNEPIQNPDGTHSSEISITVTEEGLNGGKPTNIPTVWNGKVVDHATAVRNAIASGHDFPSFNTIEEAVAWAEANSGKRLLSAENLGRRNAGP
jgi:hypothetical protein